MERLMLGEPWLLAILLPAPRKTAVIRERLARLRLRRAFCLRNAALPRLLASSSGSSQLPSSTPTRPLQFSPGHASPACINSSTPPARSNHEAESKEEARLIKMKSVLARLQISHASVEPITVSTVGNADAMSDGVASTSHVGVRQSGREGKVASDELPLLDDDAAEHQAVADSGTPVGSASGPQPWSVARVKALGFIVFSSLNFSIASVCVKFDSRFFGSQEAVFWRSAIGLLLNYIWLRHKGVSLEINPRRRWMLLLRIVVGTLGLSLRFYAMSNMVLTDATVILFTSPIATFLLGALLLKEQVKRADFANALLSFVGVVFVARPAFLFPRDAESAKDTHPLAVVAALAGSVVQAAIYICMRLLKDLDALATTHYLMVGATIFSVSMMLIKGERFIFPTDGLAIFALVATALFSSIGQIFLTLGFHQEKAGIASVMRNFDVVFVFLLDVTVLHEAVSAYSLVGGAIIFTGAVAIAMRRAHAT